METYKDNYLMHYGIPGMKWGVRKDRVKVSRKERSKYRNDQYDKAYNVLAKKRNVKSLGNKEVAARRKLAKKYKIHELDVGIKSTKGLNLNKAQKEQYKKDTANYNKIRKEAVRASYKTHKEASKIAKQKTIEKYGKTKVSKVMKTAAGAAALAAGYQAYKKINYKIGYNQGLKYAAKYANNSDLIKNAAKYAKYLA